jgi:putative CocE/NonD family hydrolase
MRRSPLVVLVATLVALLAPAARSVEPPPQPADYVSTASTLSPADYPTLARTAVEVPMADGNHLYVEVVRPHPGVHGNGPWPVILEASPYHGTLADRDGIRVFPDAVNAEGEAVGLTGYFAPRGYAVVMVDLRGTGRSSGCLDHLGANDASDLKAIVEWAADRPWSNGRVGMTGHSYVAATAVIAAAQRPTGLVTIVPSAGLASMYDHQFNKGVPWYLQWAGPQYAYEALALNRHLPPGADNISPTGDNFGNDMEGFGCGIPHSATFQGPENVTGQYSAWHAARDWRKGASAADIPVFMVHGIHDNAARIPAAEWFFGDRSPHPGDKVWIGQWDHGGAGATRCAGPDGEAVAHPTCRFDQWKYALHAWFDKHLAQRDVDTGPAVEVFLNGAAISDVTEPADPATLGAKTLARDGWDRDGDSSLTLFPDASDGSLDFAPPADDSSGSFGTVAEAVAAGVPTGALTFSSAPLAEDTVLLGLPTMKLDLSMSYGQVVDVVTTLYREDAAGDRQAISFCGIQPQLREGIETLAPVVPGEVMALDLQCFTTAQWIPAGQKLVLEVSTRTPHHASRGSDAQMTLYTGPDSSRYVLPRLTDVRLADDVRLHESEPGQAQSPIEGTVELGSPQSETTFEFDSLPGFDNAALHAEVTDIEGDVDLYLERRAGDAWEAVADGANGFDVGAPETLDARRIAPGRYRLRIVNYLSMPGEIAVAIEFRNGAGQPG